MTYEQIIQALLDEGFASSKEEAEAQLEDMGFELTDITELWELGE